MVVQPEGALALLDARTLDWGVVGDKDMNPLFILRLEALVEAADERRHPQQQGVPVVPWILEEAVRGVAVCTAANGRAALEELPDVPAAGEHGNEHGGEQVGWGGPGALREAAAPEHGAHPLPPSPCQDRILRSRKGAQALPYSHFKPKTEMQK